MEIELNQQQEQATSSVNEAQSLSHDQPTSAVITREAETSPPDYNEICGAGNSSTNQPQHVAVNIDDRFGPSCATVLSDAEIVNNIIVASKQNDRRQWLYLFYGCIPILVITCLIWIIWASIKCSSDDNWKIDCETPNTLYYSGIALACLTGIILLWALGYGSSRYSNGSRYEALRSNVRFVIKLEGTKWTRYVDYLYGNSAGGFHFLGRIGGMSFCCRKSHYQRLTERGYGYIVLCQRGFILDEMYHIIRNEPHVILKAVYVRNLGLRVYLVRKDGTYTVHRSWSEERRRVAAFQAIDQQTVPFDIYLPDNLPERALMLLALQVQHGL